MTGFTQRGFPSFRVFLLGGFGHLQRSLDADCTPSALKGVKPELAGVAELSLDELAELSLVELAELSLVEGLEPKADVSTEAKPTRASDASPDCAPLTAP